jgi:hypothetical protein
VQRSRRRERISTIRSMNRAWLSRSGHRPPNLHGHIPRQQDPGCIRPPGRSRARPPPRWTGGRTGSRGADGQRRIKSRRRRCCLRAIPAKTGRGLKFVPATASSPGDVLVTAGDAGLRFKLREEIGADHDEIRSSGRPSVRVMGPISAAKPLEPGSVAAVRRLPFRGRARGRGHVLYAALTPPCPLATSSMSREGGCALAAYAAGARLGIPGGIAASPSAARRAVLIGSC